MRLLERSAIGRANRRAGRSEGRPALPVVEEIERAGYTAR